MCVCVWRYGGGGGGKRMNALRKFTFVAGVIQWQRKMIVRLFVELILALGPQEPHAGHNH